MKMAATVLAVNGDGTLVLQAGRMKMTVKARAGAPAGGRPKKSAALQPSLPTLTSGRPGLLGAGYPGLRDPGGRESVVEKLSGQCRYGCWAPSPSSTERVPALCERRSTRSSAHKAVKASGWAATARVRPGHRGGAEISRFRRTTNFFFDSLQSPQNFFVGLNIAFSSLSVIIVCSSRL